MWQTMGRGPVEQGEEEKNIFISLKKNIYKLKKQALAELAIAASHESESQGVTHFAS